MPESGAQVVSLEPEPVDFRERRARRLSRFRWARSRSCARRSWTPAGGGTPRRRTRQRPAGRARPAASRPRRARSCPRRGQGDAWSSKRPTCSRCCAPLEIAREMKLKARSVGARGRVPAGREPRAAAKPGSRAAGRISRGPKSWTGRAEWLDVPLERLRAIDRAPSNPKWLRDAGVAFSFTTDGLEDPEDFPASRVREAIARGLSRDDALAAVTTVPARQLGLADRLGDARGGQDREPRRGDRRAVRREDARRRDLDRRAARDELEETEQAENGTAIGLRSPTTRARGRTSAAAPRPRRRAGRGAERGRRAGRDGLDAGRRRESWRTRTSRLGRQGRGGREGVSNGAGRRRRDRRTRQARHARASSTRTRIPRSTARSTSARTRDRGGPDPGRARSLRRRPSTASSPAGPRPRNVLHGSANSIGGQNATVKWRRGGGPDDLLFATAPEGIKFALGENPKRSNSSRPAAALSRRPAWASPSRSASGFWRRATTGGARRSSGRRRP